MDFWTTVEHHVIRVLVILAMVVVVVWIFVKIRIDLQVFFIPFITYNAGSAK